MFTALFTVSVAALTFLCLNVVWYVEALGFFAVFIEAIQGVPQFTRNLVNKSTEGMRCVCVCAYALVCCFICGGGGIERCRW